MEMLQLVIDNTVQRKAHVPFQEQASRPLALNPRLAVQMLSALQTTLDPEQLLAIFAEQASALLDELALGFTNQGFGLTIGKRQSGADALHYRLELEQEFLGELTLSKAHGFDVDEHALVDELVGCLLYPLRNTLQHLSVTHSALRDPLTGVLNRGALDDNLQHEIAVARRHQSPLSLLVIDIDHFKSVNDTLGHARGDAALCSLVQHIQAFLRDTDELFRFGGEEFVVMLNSTNQDGAERVAERIRHAVDMAEHDLGGATLHMTVSIGVAQWKLGENAADLFQRADQALYRAKKCGRNQTCAG